VRPDVKRIFFPSGVQARARSAAGCQVRAGLSALGGDYEDVHVAVIFAGEGDQRTVRGENRI
jgi:hypothetical protein